MSGNSGSAQRRQHLKVQLAQEVKARSCPHICLIQKSRNVHSDNHQLRINGPLCN
jgi:hypothetical protein